MELTQLRVFMELAETGDIYKAACRLEISASSVRNHIRQLEEELNYTLFNGTSPGLSLNQNGDIVFKYAENILQLTDELSGRLRDYEDLNRSVHISIDSSAEVLLQELELFARENPDIKLRIKQQQNNRNEGAFLSDIRAYVTKDKRQREYTATLMKDTVCLAVSSAHPLAKAEYVDLSDLKGESFILPGAEHKIRTIIDQCFEQAGFLPNVAIECDDWRIRSRMIAKNAGMTLSLPILYPWREEPGVALVPIRLPLLSFYVRLNWNPPEYLSHAAVKLRDYFLERFRSLQDRNLQQN